jgi:hypothetical protein
MLVSTMVLHGDMAAVKVFTTLGCPVYISGKFSVRYLWSILGISYEDTLKRFVTSLANDANVRSIYGARHVLLRLMSKLKGMHNLLSIENLDTDLVLKGITYVDDVNDLVRLGWRPNIGTFLHYADKMPVHSLIDRIAPVLWSDLSITLPMWHDSPFDPRSLKASVLEGDAFWKEIPEYWLRTEEQLRSQCPSLSSVRTFKMPMLKPTGLQQLLSIVQKSPTLIRHSWANKSLTWLNFILLYRPEYFHVLLQVLLYPHAAKTPCMCHMYRLEHINYARKQRRRYRDNLLMNDGNNGPNGHRCEHEEHTVLLHSIQCMPWYRHPPPDNRDPDRFDMIHAVLHDRVNSPWALNNLGRVVAVAHLLIILTAKGVTTTSIQLIADVVTGWRKQPTIKDLRPILANMFDLAQTITLSQSQSQSQSQSITRNSNTPPTDSHPTSSDLAQAVAAALTKTDDKADDKTDNVDRSSGQMEKAVWSCGEKDNRLVQSHLLYRRPADAVLANALKRLHLKLVDATRQNPFVPENHPSRALQSIYISLRPLL